MDSTRAFQTLEYLSIFFIIYKYSSDSPSVLPSIVFLNIWNNTIYRCYFVFDLQVLDEVKVESKMDRDMLINVARTSLRTKTPKDLADHLTEVCDFLHFAVHFIL